MDLQWYGQFTPPVDRVLFELLSERMPGKWIHKEGLGSAWIWELPCYAADVGAGNGITDSNTLYFEERGWQVLCVDPNPKYAAHLKIHRRLVEHVACGNPDEKEDGNPPETFWVYAVGAGAPDYGVSGLAVDERTLQELRAKGEIHGFWTTQVPVYSLDCLLHSHHFPRLDLLSVDVEGTELDVLKGLEIRPNNWGPWNPQVIVVENNHGEDQVRYYLQGVGYKLSRRVEVNDFYVRK